MTSSEPINLLPPPCTVHRYRDMGNSASKATSTAKQAANKSARAAGLNQQPLASSRSAPAQTAPPPRAAAPRASETKDESIMAESRDPDLAKNLQMLGQVRVPGKGMASTLHTVSCHREKIPAGCLS